MSIEACWNCRKNCAHGTRADRFEKRCRVREPPRHLAPPPVNHHSWCLSKQRASAKGPSTITDIFLESPLPQTMSLIISCIIFALIITIDISCIGSRRRIALCFRDDITSNRGCGIDQCPISQTQVETRAVHLQERSYEYFCYSRWPASHWILVHNTFEGVVTNYRRAVD